MKYPLFVLLQVALAALSLVDNAFGRNIQSWSAVEKALADVRLLEDVKALRQIPEIDEAYRLGNDDLFWEMIGKSDCPLVQFAGYTLLQGHGAPSSIEAASDLIMSQRFPLALAAKLVAAVSQDQAEVKELTSSLAMLARAHPESTQRWSMLISIIPAESLEQWYFSHVKSEMPMAYRALVLDSIMTLDLSKDLREKLNSDISPYQCVPGISRAVYVLYAAETGDNYAYAMSSVLTDASVPESVKVGVAMKHCSYIKRKINWKELHLSGVVIRVLESNDTPGSKPGNGP